MTTLLELSGSPARAGAILSAVRKISEEHKRKPTLAEINAACKDLHGWDPCERDELEAALSMLDAQADAHVASLAEPAAEPETEQPAAAAAIEPQPVDREQLVENLRLSRLALANARAALIGAQNRRSAARERLATCIQQYQVGLPRVSHLEAARDVQMTSRLVRAQGGGPYRGRPGPSAYDRERFYSAGGDATTFLKQNFLRRGGKRFGRGDVMTDKGIVRVPSER